TPPSIAAAAATFMYCSASRRFFAASGSNSPIRISPIARPSILRLCGSALIVVPPNQAFIHHYLGGTMRRPRRRSGGFVVRYDKLHSVTAELLSDDQEVGIKQDEQHHEAAHEQAEGDSFERLPIHRDDLHWPRQKFRESLERRFAGGP